jgi:copper transport protein
MRRVVVTALAVVAGFLAVAPAASAHAGLLSSSPADRAELPEAPTRVILGFSEPVELLRPSDVTVVDEDGRPVTTGGAKTSPRDASIVEVPVRPGLPPASYTVRYRIVSADSHIVDGDTTFATRGAALKEPVLGSFAEGPGEASVYSVIARFLELVGLGGALSLLAFRALVWGPAWRWRMRVAPEEGVTGLTWARERFWVGFWALLGVALLGEAAVLVTKTATSLGVSVLSALGDPAAIYRVFSETRFGTHFQFRLGLILVLVAIALWEYLAEPIAEAESGVPDPEGRPVATAAMAGLLATCLVLISSQGHASQAPGGNLSVADDAIHLLAVCVWVGGLAALTFVLLRLPRVLPRGSALGAVVMERFSRVALLAVSIAVLTGTLRALAELADPSQLWDTAYGRSIVIKVALLCPLAFLAFQNRRVLTAIAIRGRANRATLRLVARNARVELGLSLAVVLVASLLVSQVPGRV